MKQIRYYIEIIFTAIFVAILFMIFSCEGNYETINCEYCYQIEPEWGPLKIRASIDDEHPFVPVTIFRNKIEDMDTEWVDTLWHADDSIDVPVNKYYSVAAKYIVDSDTIYAIDGDKIKTKKVYDECDEDCYIIKGGIIDVRLKYD